MFEKNPLAKILWREAKTKENPREWFANFRNVTEKMSPAQIYEYLNLASRGAVERNDPYSRALAAHMDIRSIFTPTIHLEKTAPFSVTAFDELGNMVGICSAADNRFKESLGIHHFEHFNEASKGKGLLFYCEGQPIAYLKSVGLGSCLALETVADKDGNVLLARGMIYALPYNMVKMLQRAESKQEKQKGEWLGIDLESLQENRHSMSFTAIRLVDELEIIEGVEGVASELSATPPRMMSLTTEDIEWINERTRRCEAEEAEIRKFYSVEDETD